MEIKFPGYPEELSIFIYTFLIAVVLPFNRKNWT
jgi:hypothetical protein